MSGEFKQAEKRRLDEAYADEIIKTIPELLRSSEGLEKFSQIFLELGKLDSEEQCQAERIREKVAEAFLNMPGRKSLNKEDTHSVEGRCVFLRAMVSAHKCNANEIHSIVARADSYPPACLRDYLELTVKHYQITDPVSSEGDHLLHTAVLVGSVKAVTILLEFLEFNATVNEKTRENETAFDWAKMEGYRAMRSFNEAVDATERETILAKIKNYHAIMQLLRAHGAKTSEELAAEKAEAKAQTQTPSAVAGSLSKLMGEVTASEQSKTAEKENVNKAAGMPTSRPEGQQAADPDPTPPPPATR